MIRIEMKSDHITEQVCQEKLWRSQTRKTEHKGDARALIPVPTLIYDQWMENAKSCDLGHSGLKYSSGEAVRKFSLATASIAHQFKQVHDSIHANEHVSIELDLYLIVSFEGSGCSIV